MFEKVEIARAYITAKYFSNFGNREALEKWQEKKVIEHLKKVMQLSPFYKSYYSGLDVSNWMHFPTIDKINMMENFNSLNTAAIKKEEAFAIARKAEMTRDFSPQINDITIGLSSGTSGNQGIFLANKKERAEWTGNILAKTLPHTLLHKEKIAFFLRANSNLYETIKSRILQFKFFDLQNDIYHSIQQLNIFQPSLLVAPPSMLRFIAEKQNDNAIKIHPAKIISIAEVLDPVDEKYISETFQQIIHQVYQCTEGFLGATCLYGTIHLNEDIAVIQKEYIDNEHKKFIPVITDFRRITQPVIRYRLNDILTENETQCKCGSVFTGIKYIEGRCDDIFYLRSLRTNKLEPVYPDFIRKAVIESSEKISAYKVLQIIPEEIVIELEESNSIKEDFHCVTVALKGLFQKRNLVIPAMKFRIYNEIPGIKKLKRIERTFAIENLL